MACQQQALLQVTCKGALASVSQRIKIRENKKELDCSSKSNPSPSSFHEKDREEKKLKLLYKETRELQSK